MTRQKKNKWQTGKSLQDSILLPRTSSEVAKRKSFLSWHLSLFICQWWALPSVWTGGCPVSPSLAITWLSFWESARGVGGPASVADPAFFSADPHACWWGGGSHHRTSGASYGSHLSIPVETELWSKWANLGYKESLGRLSLVFLFSHL